MQSTLNYQGDELYCAGLSLKALAKQYGTPLYVYDVSRVIDNFAQFNKSLPPPFAVAYAVKANANLTLLHLLKQQGAFFDIVSGGELFKVLRVGVDPARVIYSGVGKSPEELHYAISSQVGLIAVESEAELDLLIKVAAQLTIGINIAFRINPQIDPKTHPYIATGLKNSKFGLDFALASKLLLKLKDHPTIKAHAISFHIGSQITELGPFRELAAFAKSYVLQLRQQQITINTVDVGGGLGVPYQAGQTDMDLGAYGKIWQQAFAGLNIRLIVEPGRYLVADAGLLLSKKLYSKYNGQQQFHVLDTGMNHLIRPALYQAYHEIVPVVKKAGKSEGHFVGPLCESGDFIGKDRQISFVDTDDLVAILNAGAYGSVMSSNYNAHPRPAEVVIYQGQSYLTKPRETYDDLVRNEVVQELAV